MTLDVILASIAKLVQPPVICHCAVAFVTTIPLQSS